MCSSVRVQFASIGKTHSTCRYLKGHFSDRFSLFLNASQLCTTMYTLYWMYIWKHAWRVCIPQTTLPTQAHPGVPKLNPMLLLKFSGIQAALFPTKYKLLIHLSHTLSPNINRRGNLCLTPTRPPPPRRHTAVLFYRYLVYFSRFASLRGRLLQCIAIFLHIFFPLLQY